MATTTRKKTRRTVKATKSKATKTVKRARRKTSGLMTTAKREASKGLGKVKKAAETVKHAAGDVAHKALTAVTEFVSGADLQVRKLTD